MGSVQSNINCPDCGSDRAIEDLIERITLRHNEKPGYYRYCGEYQPPEFFFHLMEVEE